MNMPLQGYNMPSHLPQSSSYWTMVVPLRSTLMLAIMLQVQSLNKMMPSDAHTQLPSTQSHYNWPNITMKYMTRNYLSLSTPYDTSATIYKAISTPHGSSLTMQTSNTL